jgi:ERCC4-type nuclease
MLYVDSREPVDIQRILLRAAKENRLLQVKVATLESADYAFGDVGIERKHIPEDLLGSVFDRRLWTQLDTLKHTYKQPYLLIEGVTDWEDVYEAGVLTTLLLFHGVQLIPTNGHRDTAFSVMRMYLKYGIERTAREPPAAVIRADKPEDIRSAMLQCIKGIGPVIARRILEKDPYLFDTDKDFARALHAVKGLRPESLAMLLKVMGQ